MQSMNIHKVKPILCFWLKKMCELAANGKDREWGGEGWVGNMRVQCNRTWSPSTFSPLLRLWWKVTTCQTAISNEGRWEVDELCV